MNTPNHILVADGNREIRDLLTEHLQRQVYRVAAGAAGKGVESSR
ncbi:MAG: hypothetical protein Q8L65_09600 [Burkholderiales bacterium]|nr:hypothetical protein [Burkholderiales bacterium]